MYIGVRLLVVKEKLAESHKHFKELEEQTNRDTTQVKALEAIAAI